MIIDTTTNSNNNAASVVAASYSSSSSSSSSSVPRFHLAQIGRTIIHPKLHKSFPNNDNNEEGPLQNEHTFVIAADTQFGMTNQNSNWDIEKEYSIQAVNAINALQPRPLYCCVCGDLVDMTSEIYTGKVKHNNSDNNDTILYTKDECDNIQDEQYNDFINIWENLHDDIALICLCGNHDIGNTPTKTSIRRFTNKFGDDYLSFYVNGTYNIVLNSNLFNDPTASYDLYEEQIRWLQQQLIIANNNNSHNKLIFVYTHHPWFLYNENEEYDELLGKTPFPMINKDTGENIIGYIPDGYFHIPKKYRIQIMELFHKYNVNVCFSGHFHQNLISKATTFNMDMIITGSLSYVLDSTGVSNVNEPKKQGFRIVTVKHHTTTTTTTTDNDNNNDKSTYEHRFVALEDIVLRN